MDHAAAHERIEDLLLDPSALAALESSVAGQDAALREHVAGCAACRADLEGWRHLQRTIASSLPGTAADAILAVDPIDLPPALRAAVAGAIRSDARDQRLLDSDPGRSHQTGALPSIAPVAPRPVAPRPSRVLSLLGVAAVLVALVGSIGITIDQASRRSAAEADAHALSVALAAVDRILAEPSRRVVALRTATGDPAGTISWSRHDWVVITSALSRPPDGQTYRCWLEANGQSVPVGAMDFAGSTAWWVASLDEWKTWEIGPTTRFVVTLEVSGGASRTGQALLSAALGS